MTRQANSSLQRTVRVPLAQPDDETWRRLRTFAAKAAQFGNHMLADLYVAHVNGVTGDALKAVRRTAYARMNEELSSWVRGAMTQNRVRGVWRRMGRNVLAGRARLACFSADRALTIEADQGSNPGALYERDGEDYVLVCRFAPVEMRDEAGKLVGRREPIRLRLAHNRGAARRDAYLREAVEAIWSGAWSPGTLTIRFDMEEHTVDAVLSYSMPGAAAGGDGMGATLGPFKPETGELWLRFDRAGVPAVNFAHRIHHMQTRKATHAGTVHRLRRKMGGEKGGRRRYRKRLEEIKDFGTWAHGRMHELSSNIVKRLRADGVSELRVAALGEGDLPWYTLKQQLAYKCEAAGIRIAVPDAAQEATHRAEKATQAKVARRLRKVRTGLAAARELLAAPASEQPAA